MSITQLEKKLLKSTKGLSESTLQEVIDFVQFLRLKKSKKSLDSITTELSGLSSSETEHLEDEFKDYRKIYPSE